MITISIVLYNSPLEEIKKLVLSLYEPKIVQQIYIVDNSKNPNENFRKLPATYIFNGKNLGYGSANNIAINKSIKDNSQYHIVINPDIDINIHVIEHLIKYMNDNQNVGLCMPNIVYPDMKRQYLCKLLPTPFDLILRRFLPHKESINRHDIQFELQKANYQVDFYAPSLSGCFMFLRTCVLQEVGGFDERFFMYLEDLDLCRRINQKYELRYVPTIPVVHHYKKESYKKFKLLIAHIISAFKYFNKWGWFFDKERKIINKETLRNLPFNPLKGE